MEEYKATVDNLWLFGIDGDKPKIIKFIG